MGQLETGGQRERGPVDHITIRVFVNAALVQGNRGRKPRNSTPGYLAASTVILTSEK